ncbi:hypothetical protein VNI00_018680 [Paramarasmius palmivorus]|uniref:Uncharacterized protein n=1 Tax=Paramarasmius palmivorus TaxID=297713 RepID=A0AAW0AUF3_9AGAR
MYSSRLSQKLNETQRFDLTGQAEINFLLARAGKHSEDEEFQERLPRILAARKVGRRRWQNRISAAKHYAQNKESKKQYSRLQGHRRRSDINDMSEEEREVKRQENRDVQARWRRQNAVRLAQRQQERRVQREGGAVERSILGPTLVENDVQLRAE